MLEKQNEAITEDISYVSDTDVAKLATQLMTMQTIYNLSLSMGSRILPPSLADYL
jgi:flagellar hook-associated protein 3 FlgL